MKAPYKVVDAEDVYLYTEDQKLIDSVSSWWSVIHGYKHPALTAAIQEQAGRFSHVMLGGLTHAPVQMLSEKLAAFLPGDLDYCFFSDSGSVAVEVALKMALQYYMQHLRIEQMGRKKSVPFVFHELARFSGERGIPFDVPGVWGRNINQFHKASVSYFGAACTMVRVVFTAACAV